VRDSPFGGADLEATPWILEENLEEDPSREVTALVYGSQLERFLTWGTGGEYATTTQERFECGWTWIAMRTLHLPVQDRVESEVDVAASERVTLLARKYVSGSLSPEADARLAIATERVRRLVPRVTADDVEALESILEDLDSISQRDAERRKRLGIEPS
jgi:hypothetical protein